ncbi:hypothetical protein M1K46_25300 [Fictibacillus sp. WQ 8-8]|uniref:hypothetical protein n=1 Tax=Fictibacillus sp. WQ 8-8 TaxID=2938788 RepID=UPI00210BBEFA|nr:hypothetical protein [Fictibacillus sp. WQ 8-8]MCQ6268874.1 hypothetical protein [Fictibacillus sp. WQ 8-8]
MEKEQLTLDLETVKISRTARLFFSNKEKVDLPADYSQKLWDDLHADNVKVSGFLTVGNTTYSLFQLIKIEWIEEPFHYAFSPVEFEFNSST